MLASTASDSCDVPAPKASPTGPGTKPPAATKATAVLSCAKRVPPREIPWAELADAEGRFPQWPNRTPLRPHPIRSSLIAVVVLRGRAVLGTLNAGRYGNSRSTSHAVHGGLGREPSGGRGRHHGGFGRVGLLPALRRRRRRRRCVLRLLLRHRTHHPTAGRGRERPWRSRQRRGDEPAGADAALRELSGSDSIRSRTERRVPRFRQRRQIRDGSRVHVPAS